MMDEINVDNKSLYELNLHCAKVMQSSESTVTAAHPEVSDEAIVMDVANRLKNINNAQKQKTTEITGEQKPPSGVTSPQESGFMTPLPVSPNPENNPDPEEKEEVRLPDDEEFGDPLGGSEQNGGAVPQPTPTGTASAPPANPADGREETGNQSGEGTTQAPPPTDATPAPNAEDSATQTASQATQENQQAQATPTDTPVDPGEGPAKKEETHPRGTAEQEAPAVIKDITKPSTVVQASVPKVKKDTERPKGNGNDIIPNTFQTKDPSGGFWDITGIPTTPVMNKGMQLAALRKVIQGQSNAAFLPEPNHMEMYTITESPLEDEDVVMDNAFNLLEDRILSRVSTMTNKVRDQLEKAQAGITSSLSYISDINGTLDKTLTQINDTIERMPDMIVNKIKDSSQLTFAIAEVLNNHIGPKSELGRSITKCHTRLDNVQTTLGAMEANFNAWRNSSVSISNATPRVATATYLNLPEINPQQISPSTPSSSAPPVSSLSVPAMASSYVANINALKVNRRFGAPKNPQINPAQALSDWILNSNRSELSKVFSDVSVIDNHLASLTILKSPKDFMKTFGELFE
ncbi:MAG: hypothetical protein [brine shrimp arlivirus 4]|nr:MAG: hypothetical protein [brine shrimp arlivirus 4]